MTEQLLQVNGKKKRQSSHMHPNNLAPLKDLAIIKLQGQNPYGVKLNGAPPKFGP